MPGQTVLVTGANKSIGYETARRMGALGYGIWLGCRDLDRGEAAAHKLRDAGCAVRVIAIEVTNDESVEAAAARVMAEDGRLDVLVNNAGIPGSYAPPSLQPMAEIKDVYEVNVFGPIRVTQAFLPLLKAAPRANVVMVSSGLGSLGWLTTPGHEFYGVNIMGYNSSKTALNAITVAFAKELMASGIKVNAADPGYTATDFNGHSGYRTVEQAADVMCVSPRSTRTGRPRVPFTMAGTCRGEALAAATEAAWPGLSARRESASLGTGVHRPGRCERSECRGGGRPRGRPGLWCRRTSTGWPPFCDEPTADRSTRAGHWVEADAARAVARLTTAGRIARPRERSWPGASGSKPSRSARASTAGCRRPNPPSCR